MNSNLSTNFFEAEASVAGAVLIDPGCLPAVLGIVRPEDFTTEVCRSIIVAARDLQERGEPIDPVTVKNEINRQGGHMANVKLVEYIQMVVDSRGVEQWAAYIRDAAMRRKILALAGELSRQVEEGEDWRRIVADGGAALDALCQSDTTADVLSSSDAMLEWWRYREQVDAAPEGVAVATGYRLLDKLLGGGLVNEGLYIIGARPGMGKTTLAVCIADQVVQAGKRVLFVSLEMSTNQLTTKRLARETMLGYTQLLTEPVLEEDYKRVAQAGIRLSKTNLYTNRKNRLTVADIGILARRVKDLDLIVVDYMGLIKPERRTGRSRYEEMTEISGELKALASNLGVPLLCLCQLNRQNTARQDKRPMLSDLRDTGAVEQDADGVILLHRPGYYQREESDAAPEDEEIELIVAKNRHGNTGVVKMDWIGSVGRIVQKVRSA